MHAGPGKSRRLSARRLLSGTRGRSILGTRRGLVLVVMALAVLGASISTARVAYAQPQNSFWWGSDSFQPSAASGSPPIPEPYNPSSWYQGYIAEVETYWTVLGCGAGRAVNSGNVTQANAEVASHGWCNSAVTQAPMTRYYAASLMSTLGSTLA